MNLLQKIKGYFAFPSSGADELESVFADEMYLSQARMGGVIMAFEALMIISTLARGGPGDDLRWRMYFGLYVGLFTLTAAVLATLLYLHYKKPQHVRYQIRLSICYAVILCVWGCFVTLLDQRSGSNLNVYSYILMAMSVFFLLKPWQSLALYGGGFLLLNAGAIALQDNPIFFQHPASSFGLIVNSLFLTILAVIVSITLFRYRIMKWHDRTVINAINQQLNALAKTDQLTGAGNRRFLEEKMHTLLGEGCGQIAGLMLDIDFFKQYNDHYGHQAGDLCLRELSGIMHAFAAEEGAFLVRYGGEEFFLGLPQCTSPMEKAERLRQRIEERGLSRSDLPGGRVTVSVGVDVEERWQDIGQDEFLRRCDQALYEAKNSGRNKVCLYRQTSK